MAAPTKMQRVLNEAEATLAAKADETKAELADAKAALPALRERAQEAEDGITAESEVLSRVRKGEDVAPIDLVIARADDELAKIKHDALSRRVIGLERSLPVETVLAEKVAGVFKAAVPGFDVYTTPAPAKSWQFPEDSTAIVVVAERGIERDRFTGLVSGKVTVLVQRPSLYRSVAVEAVEAEAKTQRVALSITSHVEGKTNDPAGYVTDTLTIDVSNVIDGHAVISRVDLSALPSRDWVEEVYRANGGHPSGLPGTDKEYRWAVALGPNTVATGHDAQIASEQIDEAGIRTLVVEQKINTFRSDPGDFAELLTAAIDLDHGTTHIGMGTLVDSEVEARSVDHAQQFANWQIRLTFESAVR
jgi:hypothetical protein